MPTTANYNFVMPTVGGSSDTWGTILVGTDGTIPTIDTELFRVEGLIGAKLNAASPAFTGILTGPSAVISGGVTAAAFVGALTGNVTGNATTATRLATGRTIALSGPITAVGVSFDGSANITLTTAIADAALSIAKTSGLQAALDGKEATLAASQKRVINYGTAAVGGTLAEGEIYLQHEA